MAGRGLHESALPKVQNRIIAGRDLRSVPLPDGLDVTGSFVQRAREHLRALEGFAGLPAEFEADPRVSKTSGGGAVVHMRQQFKSIPVFLGAQTVRFRPDGLIDSSAGATFTFNQDIPVEPRLTAPQAVLAAAKHTAQQGQGLLGEPDDFGNALDPPTVNLTGFQPSIIAAFPELPTQPTVLAPGPFGYPIKASLTWYPEPVKALLGWQVTLTMPQGAGQYLVIVDANSGAILYSTQLVDLLIARGSVYVVDGSTRQSTSFPRRWADYAVAFDPAALPDGVPPEPAHWVDDATGDTVGNYVYARLGESGPPLKARKEGGVAIFEPTAPDGDDQKVLNIFYYNCYLHDLFYLLGFREEDGNFQQTGVGGMSGDRVDARAHSGAVWGTANMLTLPDGTSPVMNMGLVESTQRHTAFDASVVFHEYMHGVTNRLVGGPMNTQALQQPQSKAMGEGWGDYLACTLTNSIVVGQWVTGKPGGIRSHPYDDQYPGTFGQIGQGIYVAPHKVGEIWCATLLAMNRNLNARLGSPRGQRLGLQLVVDALKLSPANPNMLEMRDSILAALDQRRRATPRLSDIEFDAAKTAIWAAFAKFGMGVGARSAGASFSDVVEDSTPGAAGPSGPTPTPPTDDSSGGPARGVVRKQESERVLIPDNQPSGITRTLRLEAAGRIKRATLQVNINHAYVGDLVVKLVPPNRPAIALHNQTYQEAPDLVADYKTSDKLAPLVGHSAGGEWKLSIADKSQGDTGTLRGWGLEIELDSAGEASGLDEQAPATGVGHLVADASRLVRNLQDVVAQLVRALPR